MGVDNGLKGVLSASARAARDGAAAPEADQLDLLPEVRFVGATDAGKIAALGERERKRGRPPGAGNLSTSEWRKFLLGQGITPLLTMGRWLLVTPEEMAQRLGIDVCAAFDRQVAIADKLAPYLHSRVAPTDDKGNVAPMLGVFLGGQGLNTDAGGVPPWARAFEALEGEAVEIQGLSGSGSSSISSSVNGNDDNTSNHNTLGGA